MKQISNFWIPIRLLRKTGSKFQILTQPEKNESEQNNQMRIRQKKKPQMQTNNFRPLAKVSDPGGVDPDLAIKKNRIWIRPNFEFSPIFQYKELNWFIIGIV